MTQKKIATYDRLIWRLLQDPDWKVTADGEVQTRCLRGGRGRGPWRRAGWVSPSRNGTKLYRRVKYHDQELYEHRIVFAARYGYLSPYKTVNHKNLRGCVNHPQNLELVTPAANLRHAAQYYKRSGMSAAEEKANWISSMRGQRETANSNSKTRTA